MLENNHFSRIGFYVVISFLIGVIVFLTYQATDYRQAYKGRRIELSFQKGQMEELKESLKNINAVAKQYYIMAMQYEAILKKGIIVQEDSNVFLPKGTVVIFPPQTPESQ